MSTTICHSFPISTLRCQGHRKICTLLICICRHYQHTLQWSVCMSNRAINHKWIFPLVCLSIPCQLHLQGLDWNYWESDFCLPSLSEVWILKSSVCFPSTLFPRWCGKEYTPVSRRKLFSGNMYPSQRQTEREAERGFYSQYFIIPKKDGGCVRFKIWKAWTELFPHTGSRSPMRDHLTQVRGNIFLISSKRYGSFGFGPWGVIDSGLLARVTETVLSARAPSTRRLCELKCLIVTWCRENEVTPTYSTNIMMKHWVPLE